MHPEEFFSVLSSEGISFFTGVPDSLLKHFCTYVFAHVPSERHVVAANEGNAVALAAGHHLATRGYGLVYMQNSGLGNAVNPLLSLADPEVYQIPMLLLVGWRGEPGRHDEPQHVKQGRVTLELLDTMDIPYFVLDSASDWKGLVAEACRVMKSESRPAALVVRAGALTPLESPSAPRPNPGSSDLKLSREEALRLVVDQLGPEDVIVSTTGMLSRELFEYRQAAGTARDYSQDFLTVGSMGHASHIALGIALSRPDRNVYCLDGDGSVLMHGGSLAIVGQMRPGNFRHVLFNNGAHDSVGGQPTAGFDVRFTDWAKSCGYRDAWLAVDRDEVVQGVRRLQRTEGPAMLELRVKRGARADLGRPTTSPIENKELFMKGLER